MTYKLLERMVEVFDVMPASLFFAPGTAGFDDTDANIINSIVKSGIDDVAFYIAEK